MKIAIKKNCIDKLKVATLDEKAWTTMSSTQMIPEETHESSLAIRKF